MSVYRLSTFANKRWRIFHFKMETGPARRRAISKVMKRKIFAAQKGTCMYCKKYIHQRPADYDCDHIIPVQYGGPTCRSNLQLLCVRCHRTKSGRERGIKATPAAHHPSLVINTKGYGIRISPQEIQKVVADPKSAVYRLDFGEQKKESGGYTGTRKEITPINTFLKRANEIQIQDYFKDTLSEAQIIAYKKSPRTVFNAITATGRADVIDKTRLVQDHVEIHTTDSEVVRALHDVVKHMGYRSLWDRDTWVRGEAFDKMEEKLSSIEPKYIRTRAEGSKFILRNYLKQILGIIFVSRRIHRKIETTYHVYGLRSVCPEWDPDPTQLEPEGEDEKVSTIIEHVRRRPVSFVSKGSCQMAAPFKNMH